MKNHPSCKHIIPHVNTSSKQYLFYKILELSSILEVPGEISFIVKTLIKSQLNDTEPTIGILRPQWDDMMKFPAHRTVKER